MTGKPENNGHCPLCGGRLMSRPATIPFLVRGTVIVIKDVPARICEECDEPFLAGPATDTVTDLLAELRSLRAEVSVIVFPDHARNVPVAA
jgi:YgiT-type zinc finger domain-containing protein